MARRLFFEGLETRKLLAGDLVMETPSTQAGVEDDDDIVYEVRGPRAFFGEALASGDLATETPSTQAGVEDDPEMVWELRGPR